MKSKVSKLVIECCVSCIAIAILSLVTVQAASEVTPVITLPPGGTTYLLGAGIASICNKYMPELNLVHETASGSREVAFRMMYLQGMKRGCFGTLGAMDGWSAYNGKNEYAEKPFPNIRAVVINNRSEIYLVVPANSSIKSIGDVKGKRIGVGTPGSATENVTSILFDHYGITKRNYKPYYYLYRETMEGIQDGSLDGGILAGMYPIANYTELSARENMRIVPVEGEEIVKKMMSEHPYLYRAVVKAKSYKGVEKDTPVIGFTGAYFSHAGVSSEFVYKLLKTLFEHRAEYYNIHPGAKVMTPESAMEGIPVPFHPGAEKYYKEIGVIKN